MLFDILCRLDRNGIVDEVPQKKKQKVATGNSINKILLGLSLAVPRKSWDRSVVIVLLTFCTTCNCYRVLLASG